jgi:regulatory protein
MSWHRARKRTDEVRADPAAALAAAVALLARRDYASGELREKLRVRGFDEQAAAAAAGELTREGALNDERYASNYVAWHAARGQGPQRIAAQLRRHGLEAALIDAALAAGHDWSALARQLSRARFGAGPPVSAAQRARQVRFLQYRGFSADHIRAATGADADLD